jgi:hypothetical protein
MNLSSFGQSDYIIVGPQNDCSRGISKNIHTDIKDFEINGNAKLKITTNQHRFFDNSKIYDAISGQLIWEWKGESSSATWYSKEHYIEINAKRLRIEFTQGYSDPFCNGYVKVEIISSNNHANSDNINDKKELINTDNVNTDSYKSALDRLDAKRFETKYNVRVL